MIHSLRKKHFYLWLVLVIVLFTAIVFAYLGSVNINLKLLK